MGSETRSPKETETKTPEPGTAEAWSGPVATKFDTKMNSEYFDPCQDAAQRSIRCLRRNDGDREMCGDFFQAYRDCKEQWQNARREARRKKPWFS